MKANQRRQAISQLLETSDSPVSAGQLAQKFGVSRQVIVGDVALLRAQELDIIATHRGYLLADQVQSPRSRYQGKVACQHGSEQVEQELDVIVSHGGKVLDVEVEHPLYGLIRAPLNIDSQEGIDYFMAALSTYQDSLLSSLTDGIHLHTISCPDKTSFKAIEAALEEAGLLLTDS